MNLSLMPVIARITTVARERAIPPVVALPGGEVEGLAKDGFALTHDLFLAGPVAPPLERAGRLAATKLVELRRVLA